MKRLHLSDIRVMEKVLSGHQKQLLIFDPESRLISADLKDDVMLARDMKGLQAKADNLKTDSYNLVLLTKLEQLPEVPSPHCILSLTKVKTKSFQHYNYRSWYYINNPDASIRWIYDQQLKKPTFLNLCNSQHKLTNYIIKLFQLFFLLGLRKYISSGQIHVYHQQPMYIDQQLEGICYDGYSIYTGNPGENRKIVLELHLKNKTFAFAKFALNKSGQTLIHEEKEALGNCHTMMSSAAVYPKIIRYTEDLLVLTDIRPSVPESNISLNLVHLEALKEMYYQSDKTIQFTSSPLFAKIYENICNINCHPVNELEDEMIAEIKSRLLDLLLTFDEETPIEVGLAHNDFNPWNTFMDRGKLHIYDWEQAKNDYPLLHDFFHFIFQSKVMICHQGYAQIRAEIEGWEQNLWMREFLADFNLNLPLYYRLYLLITVSHYMKQYSYQSNLYPHTLTMIHVWKEALEDIQVKPDFQPVSQLLVRAG